MTTKETFHFGANRQQAEDAGLLGNGDYLKLKEGDNRLRLMSKCLPHVSDFKGQRSFKWLCYVLDRRDGKCKPFFMPHKIYKAIEALQQNPDYAFDTVPMPYDLTISAKGAGTKEVEYTLMPARKETAVTAVEYQLLADLKPLEELQQKLKEKGAQRQSAQQAERPEPPPSDDDHVGPVDDDSIPF